MAFELSLLFEAEKEYQEALKWYKGRSVEVADHFLIELADAFEALENQPTFYGYYVKPYRRILLKSFPYKIVYEIAGDKIIIHAVFHTSRNDVELRKRLP